MKLKWAYLAGYTACLSSIISILSTGLMTYFSLFYAFAFIPLFELMIKPDDSNFTQQQANKIESEAIYDWLLYIVVPIQYLTLFIFLYSIKNESHTYFELIGKTISMGISCGVIGINVGHELGHRNRPFEQWLSKLLLFSSLYGHFFVEHNKGHHKRVSTPEDPASARYGENFYKFLVRSMFGSFKSAIEIESKMMKKLGLPIYSWQNQMVQIMFFQILLSSIVFFYSGVEGLVFFTTAAFIGGSLLEVVNYIEHYGLERKKNISGRYEKVTPAHSWNSNHILGRALLFELSRHSDHHANVNKKYQVLKHYENSPQMPTGYPGMIILATIPFLWFKVMHKQIDIYRDKKIIN